ncbi:MAG: enoyl-ACP reductase [Acidovorax sp. 17-64-282]|nr:MAG: enoyl-ACP reductase [Acidovorax sp. 17-64-282]
MTKNNNAFSLAGKKGLILGLANENSIAWGCTQLAHQMGAELVVSCLNDKARRFVEPLTGPLGVDLVGCNGQVIDSSRKGFSRAMEVSCHSFAELARLCVPHMAAGGSLLSMTYLGADEAVPNYGLMGPVKAALESLVRYMALELGPQGIRVHAVSPGPILTRAASGIASFDELMANAVLKAPLQRLVTLDEIAQLSVFLCSDAASGMTGQTIYVDGGCHAVA